MFTYIMVEQDIHLATTNLEDLLRHASVSLFSIGTPEAEIDPQSFSREEMYGAISIAHQWLFSANITRDNHWQQLVLGLQAIASELGFYDEDGFLRFE